MSKMTARYIYGLRRPSPVSSRRIGSTLLSVGRQVSPASLPVPGPCSRANSTSPGDPPSLPTSALVASTSTSVLSSGGRMRLGLQVLVLFVRFRLVVVDILEFLVFVGAIDDVGVVGLAHFLLVPVAIEFVCHHASSLDGGRSKADTITPRNVRL